MTVTFRMYEGSLNPKTPKPFLQAAQVRKACYVPDPGLDYDPEANRTCTVYAGTVVQQVSANPIKLGDGFFVSCVVVFTLLTAIQRPPCCLRRFKCACAHAATQHQACFAVICNLDWIIPAAPCCKSGCNAYLIHCVCCLFTCVTSAGLSRAVVCEQVRQSHSRTTCVSMPVRPSSLSQISCVSVHNRYGMQRTWRKKCWPWWSELG